MRTHSGGPETAATGTRANPPTHIVPLDKTKRCPPLSLLSNGASEMPPMYGLRYGDGPECVYEKAATAGRSTLKEVLSKDMLPSQERGRSLQQLIRTFKEPLARNPSKNFSKRFAKEEKVKKKGGGNEAQLL